MKGTNKGLFKTYQTLKTKLTEDRDRATRERLKRLAEQKEIKSQKKNYTKLKEKASNRTSVRQKDKVNGKKKEKNTSEIAGPSNIVEPKLPETLTKKQALKRNAKKGTKKSKRSTLSPKSLELKRQYERENKRKQRAKLTPEALEKKRAYDREYIKRKKESGLHKTIKDLSEREKRKCRKQWKIYKRNSRLKKKRSLANNASLDIPNLDNSLASIEGRCSSRKKLGRKKINLQKSQIYRNFKICQKKLATATKRAERYKKRLQRIFPRAVTPSPNTKVKKLTQGLYVRPAIKKRLLFAEVMTKQLQENKQKFNPIGKQLLGKFIAGKYWAYYRMIGQLSEIVSYKMFRKVQLAQTLHTKRTKNKNALPEHIAHLVRIFYEENSNSKMCPGKRDSKTIGKIKKQKRLLLDTLKHLHEKFIKTHSIQLSYATFCRLRPYWVCHPKITDRNTCACVKHANMQLIVNKLKNLAIVSIKSSNDLPLIICCDKNRKGCMYRNCFECKNKEYIPVESLAEDKYNEETTYYQWQGKVEDRKVKDKILKVKLTQKTPITCSIRDLVVEFNRLTPAFLIHLFNIDYQYIQTKQIRDNLKQKEVQIYIDFSENYILKMSEEVQSMHFGASQKQISLQTGVIYHTQFKKSKFSKSNKTKENYKALSFCTASSNLEHGAHAIWAHLQPILLMVKEKFPSVDTIHFVSDGPTAQYKNRYNLFFLTFFLPSFFPGIMKATWNFTEAGHGKGPMDGVGAVAKRTADRLVSHGKDLSCVTDFVTKVQEECPGVLLVEIPSDNIEKMKAMIPTKVPAVSGLMKIHQATWSLETPQKLCINQLSCLTCNPGTVCDHHPLGIGKGFMKFDCKPTSTLTRCLAHCTVQSNDLPVPHSKELPVNVKVTDWVAVIWDGAIWYPGMVEENNAGMLTVIFMVRNGKKFSWPVKDDRQQIKETAILCKLKFPPYPISSRFFELPNCEDIDILCAEAIGKFT